MVRSVIFLFVVSFPLAAIGMAQVGVPGYGNGYDMNAGAEASQSQFYMAPHGGVPGQMPVSGYVPASGQVGMPGLEYGNTVAAGDGVQMYPYDQQDPWLHGYFQRVPPYGGFSSFRPYNYRHVFAQTQIASGWGAAHGMPYSQQFWNRYRASYLDQNLHSQATEQTTNPYPAIQSIPTVPHNVGTYPAGQVRRIGYESQRPAGAGTHVGGPVPHSTRGTGSQRPIHIYPGQ